MSYFEEENKPDYKFEEDVYVDELMDYITGTYGTQLYVHDLQNSDQDDHS